MATTYTPVRKKVAGEIVKDSGLDANTNAVGGEVYSGGVASLTLIVTPVSGSHAVHVTKLQGSIDRANWVDTATAVNGGGSAVLTNPVYPYHRAKIATIESGASVVDVYVRAKTA